MIVTFKFEASSEAAPLTDPIEFNQNHVSLVAKPKTYLAYCKPRGYVPQPKSASVPRKPVEDAKYDSVAIKAVEVLTCR